MSKRSGIEGVGNHSSWRFGPEGLSMHLLTHSYRAAMFTSWRGAGAENVQPLVSQFCGEWLVLRFSPEGKAPVTVITPPAAMPGRAPRRAEGKRKSLSGRVLGSASI